MDRNQITLAWKHLTTMIATVWRAGTRSDRLAEDPAPNLTTSDSGYFETGAKPYSPEPHWQRSESSLHLSC